MMFMTEQHYISVINKIIRSVNINDYMDRKTGKKDYLAYNMALFSRFCKRFGKEKRPFEHPIITETRNNMKNDIYVVKKNNGLTTLNISEERYLQDRIKINSLVKEKADTFI